MCYNLIVEGDILPKQINPIPFRIQGSVRLANVTLHQRRDDFRPKRYVGCAIETGRLFNDALPIPILLLIHSYNHIIHTPRNTLCRNVQGVLLCKKQIKNDLCTEWRNVNMKFYSQFFYPYYTTRIRKSQGVKSERLMIVLCKLCV